ncbi:hypothetical protein [Vibrio nigripulchritudo]|uniref:hypothetical protein n=1 Tax=Vibrio nigripulchritudo TaxID=28173 RepID=UPI000AB5D36B|nr:hypothetical protein [Vibrio nigripulchritudo]
MKVLLLASCLFLASCAGQSMSHSDRGYASVIDDVTSSYNTNWCQPTYQDVQDNRSVQRCSPPNHERAIQESRASRCATNEGSCALASKVGVGQPCACFWSDGSQSSGSTTF